jgi:hypothetical protein
MVNDPFNRIILHCFSLPGQYFYPVKFGHLCLYSRDSASNISSCYHLFTAFQLFYLFADLLRGRVALVVSAQQGNNGKSHRIAQIFVFLPVNS